MWTRRQLLVLDPDERAASSAASCVSAATAATGSPWYFVSPTARTGRSRDCGPKRGIGCGQVGGGHDEPDAGHGQGARVASIAPIRARATSSVTSLTWSTSSRWMSATYCCSPGDPRLGHRRGPTARRRVTAATASRAARRSVAGGWRRGAARRPRRSRQLDGLDDLLVAGAAAQVAGEALLDLGAGRVRDVDAAAPGRDELARDAEPALDGAGVEERLLERVRAGRRPPAPRRSSPSAPSASTASTRHESTLRPSSSTVHAPHSPTRQHSFVPVRPRSSRSTSSSVWCAATSTDRAAAH